MNKNDKFSELLGDVSKIKSTKKANISHDFYKPKIIVEIDKKQFAKNFEHSAISQHGYDIGVEDSIEFRQNGVQNSLFKKLEKGELTIYESIDLHGLTTLEAEVYMSNTIDSQRYHHMTCIRIVHGKGYSAGDKPYDKPAPKLKNFTARYLSEHHRVLAFTSCPHNRGGTGAVYVLIKKFDNSC